MVRQRPALGSLFAFKVPRPRGILDPASGVLSDDLEVRRLAHPSQPDRAWFVAGPTPDGLLVVNDLGLLDLVASDLDLPRGSTLEAANALVVQLELDASPSREP